ncbi:unnamed protein product [Rotaria sp. Silwood1]|nr:unnamed protein product [Rotaria sp. Silwood1]
MNVLNIIKHLHYLTQTEYGSENSSTTADEILTAERLFEVLKSINVSYFTELYTYDTLELDDEYDELTDEEQSNDDINDYNDNEHSDINDHFTLEEMEKIVEWVDQHPNAGLATISHRFKKTKKDFEYDDKKIDASEAMNVDEVESIDNDSNDHEETDNENGCEENKNINEKSLSSYYVRIFKYSN